MGLLDRARAWSNKTLEKNESVIVEYYRNDEKIGEFPARPTHPVDLIDSKTAVAITTSDRDFLINHESLVTTDGEPITPELDDRIVQTIRTRRLIFVVTKRDRDRWYTNRDGGETSIRIHAKFYGEE